MTSIPLTLIFPLWFGLLYKTTNTLSVRTALIISIVFFFFGCIGSIYDIIGKWSDDASKFFKCG